MGTKLHPICATFAQQAFPRREKIGCFSGIVLSCVRSLFILEYAITSGVRHSICLEKA